MSSKYLSKQYLNSLKSFVIFLRKFGNELKILAPYILIEFSFIEIIDCTEPEIFGISILMPFLVLSVDVFKPRLGACPYIDLKIYNSLYLSFLLWQLCKLSMGPQGQQVGPSGWLGPTGGHSSQGEGARGSSRAFLELQGPCIERSLVSNCTYLNIF